MNTRNLNLINKLIDSIVISLTFLVPIFFLPITTDFFELNKMALLVLGSLILLVLWGIKILLTKKLAISSSPLDLPILLSLAVFILSTIFSINKDASIFGTQGRWFPSLIGFATLVVLYYSSASNIDKSSTIKAAVYSFLLASSISSLVAILGYYNTPLRLFDNVMFTFSGSINSALFVASLGTALSLIMMFGEKNQFVKMSLTVVALTNFSLLLVLNNVVSWVLLLTGLLAVAYMVPVEQIKQSKLNLYVAAGFIISLVLLAALPATNKVVINNNFPREINLDVTGSWIVTSSSLRDFPILGSGPSTFNLNYTRYKPIYLNNGNEWSLRFDKPFNELFNVMSTMGILGTAALVFLGIAVIKLAFKIKNMNMDRSEEGNIAETLSAGLIITLVSFLVTYAYSINAFALFLFSALLVSKIKMFNKETDLVKHVVLSFTSVSEEVSLSSLSAVKKEYFHYVISAPVFALAIAGFLLTYRTYAAEVYMKQALVAAQKNNGNTTYQMMAKAINTNPRKDVYHNLYAQVNIALANSVASKANLSDTDKQTLQSLVSQAIRSSRISTEMLNPLNPVNWEVRASVYKALIGAAENSEQWTINAYNTAIQLDPTNPKLRLDLGGVYYAKKDYLTAANLFRQATTLKPNYANAYYNFAEALYNLKDYKNAKTSFEAALSLVEKGSADYKKVAEELNILKELPVVAGAAAESSPSEKPSIEPITQNTGATEQENVKQEPLTDPNQLKKEPKVSDIVNPSTN